MIGRPDRPSDRASDRPSDRASDRPSDRASVRRPRVLVAGAFGQGNPGDQSVLDAFVSALDGCDVSATVGTVPPSAAYRPVPSNDRGAVARAVVDADLTVATATVLKTLHPSTGRPPLGLLVNTMAMAGAARAMGRPIALAGVGAGDLPGGAAGLLARGIVASAGHVEIRDEESADALRAAGVKSRLPVGADVVWATLPEMAPVRRRRPVAVITLSHLAGGPDLIKGLQATAAVLHDAGYEVALQPWQPPRDLAMAAAVASGAGVPVRLWEPPADVAEAAAALADAALVIGLRFHSLVAAGAAGVPFVAVAHEPKLAGLARRLEQQAVAPSSVAALPAAVRRALDGPGPARHQVEQERRRAVATLERTRELAFERLDRIGDRSRVGLRHRPAGRRPSRRVSSSALPPEGSLVP